MALWLAYGLFQGDSPAVAANLVTFALAATILVTTLVVERQRGRA